MRTWVWSGVALTLFAATGFCLVADRAVRQPDSFVGRCAVSAFKLTSHISPIVFNRATRVLPCRGLSECKSTLPDKPTCFQEAPACENGNLTFEPIVVDTPGVEFVQPEYDVPESGGFILASETSAPKTPMFMPYAGDEVPCEFACGVDAGVLGWFGCDRSCLQMIGHCLNALQTAVAVEQPQQPEDVSPLPVQEQPAQVDGQYYHRMQEDSNYHHHYPCCPYTGRCPQPYPTAYPVIPRADEPDMNQSKPSPDGASADPSPKAPLGSVDTMECRPEDILKGIDG